MISRFFMTMNAIFAGASSLPQTVAYLLERLKPNPNNGKVILDLCGGTGSWSKPYVDAGYTVLNVTLPYYDILLTEIHDDRITFRGKDRLEGTIVLCEDIYGILAAPPCTMFSLARTTAKTPRDFVEGMKVVRKCLEIIWIARARGNLKFWAMENPTAYLRQFLGMPALTFHPYDFGDRYKKRTDIWGYFNQPRKKPVVLTEKEIYQSKVNARPLPKIKDLKLSVADRRAITSQGFANAFYRANK